MVAVHEQEADGIVCLSDRRHEPEEHRDEECFVHLASFNIRGRAIWTLNVATIGQAFCRLIFVRFWRISISSPRGEDDMKHKTRNPVARAVKDDAPQGGQVQEAIQQKSLGEAQGFFFCALINETRVRSDRLLL